MTVFSDSPQMAVRLMKCDADCAESKLATCMKRVQVDGAMFGRVRKREWVMPSKLPKTRWFAKAEGYHLLQLYSISRGIP